MGVVHGKDDRLGWQCAAGICGAFLHDLFNHSLGSAHVGDFTLQVAAFKIDFADFDPLLFQLALDFGRQLTSVNALDLEIGLCFQHAVLRQVLLFDGSLIGVVKCRQAIRTFEQLKGIVIEIVGRRRRNPRLRAS